MAKKKRISKKRTDTPSFKDTSFEDPTKTTSDHKGLYGILETLLRRFKHISFFILISPLALAYILILGISFTPGFLLFQKYAQLTENWMLLEKAFAGGITLALTVVFFWLSMIFVVPLFNFPLIFLVKPIRGTWYSLNIIPWFYHNALVQLARYTVLDFLTPSYINLFFFKMMGMKIGKGVVINSSNISDPCLIQLDDYVTIGGSATIFAHYGMKGYLIVDRVHIKKGTTIGLKASVMGNVVIGERVMVTPHTVIMPKSRIEADTIVGD